MAIEAELVYRAQDTAGRKDAAYVIQFEVKTTYFLVTVKWGSWENYRNATLQSKVEYTGTSRSAAQSTFVSAMRKREQRGYELQHHLSKFPSWIPLPFAQGVQDFTRLSKAATDAASSFLAMQKAIAEADIVLQKEPEPEPTGRVRHSRRIDL